MRAALAGAILLTALSWRASAQTAPAVAVAGRIPESAADAPRPAPRLADGHPDLGNGKGSWNPRVMANLSGLGDPNRSRVERIVDVPFHPWAKAVYDERHADLQKPDPESRCLPPGIPRMMATPFPFQIFQLSDRVLFVFEGGAHVWRAIYTDGRPHPKDPNPSFLGDSVGHWEGDTLVIETTNFKRWGLDDYFYTNPNEYRMHSDALKTIERISWKNAKTISYNLTIDDPKICTAAWSQPFEIAAKPEWDAAGLYEYVCEENNRCPGGKCTGK